MILIQHLSFNPTAIVLIVFFAGNKPLILPIQFMNPIHVCQHGSESSRQSYRESLGIDDEGYVYAAEL